MLFVVDTSSLIVLQKLGWLEELSHPEDEFLCPPKVIQELKNNKKVLKELRKAAITVTNVEKPLLITEISETDVEVISLAHEKVGSILSDDAELRNKAQILGISAFNTAGFVMLCYQHERFDKSECLTRLKTLVSRKFLSQTVYRQILRSTKI